MTNTTFLFSHKYRANFKALANNRSITACDIVLLNAMRGLPLDRGFTPITNHNKLSNGAGALDSFKSALWNAQYRLRKYPDVLFGVPMTDEQREYIISQLNGGK